MEDKNARILFAVTSFSTKPVIASSGAGIKFDIEGGAGTDMDDLFAGSDLDGLSPGFYVWEGEYWFDRDIDGELQVHQEMKSVRGATVYDLMSFNLLFMAAR